jgi:hypothetical protein
MNSQALPAFQRRDQDERESYRVHLVFRAGNEDIIKIFLRDDSLRWDDTRKSSVHFDRADELGGMGQDKSPATYDDFNSKKSSCVLTFSTTMSQAPQAFLKGGSGDDLTGRHRGVECNMQQMQRNV